MACYAWLMMIVRMLCVIAAISAVAGKVAFAADSGTEEVVTGQVVDSHVRWSGNKQIVTESQIRTEDGTGVTVIQTGGTLDGYTTHEFHGPALLRVGDQVTLLGYRATPATEKLWILDIEALQRATPQYTRAQTTDGVPIPIAWTSGCVFITYHIDGTNDLPGDTEFEVMDDVFKRWEDDTSECSYLKFVLTGREDREVGDDQVNMVIFREQEWCRPPVDGEPKKCYRKEAGGVTVATFINDVSSDNNGNIVDADIELNAVNFAITHNSQTLGSGPAADLANILTHEVGHLMGLHHTCFDPTGSDPRYNDENGVPIPICNEDTNSAKVKDATMYNFNEPGETKKSSPEPDDIAGVCAAYPIGNDPNSCEVPDASSGGCCSVTKSAHSPPLSVLLLAGFVVFALYFRFMGRAYSQIRKR